MADRPTYQYDQATATQGNKSRWWKEEEVGRHMVATACALEEEQRSTVEDGHLAWARLYANQRLSSLYSAGVVGSPVGLASVDSSGGSRYTYNVIQSVIDTVTSKVAKTSPRIMFLTGGGDYKQQLEAKSMTKFVDGLFYQSDAYQVGKRVCVDAQVFGDGWAKVYAEDATIKVERVFPWEVIVSETEAAYGTPSSMYHKKFIYRDVAMDLFGDTEERRGAIESARPMDTEQVGTRHSDMIPIYEGWHLPSKKGGKDGRHVIGLGLTTLADEPWTRSWFPLIPMRWADRVTGIRGIGLAEQLAGIQLEINKLLRTVQRAQHLMAVPRIYVEHGSKVLKQHINNEVGTIVEYTGSPPVVSVGAAMSPEVYNHIETLFRRAYEIAGVSMMSATGTKPSGLDAAVALREYNDLGTERLVPQGQRYERFFQDLATVMIDMARDMYRTDDEEAKVDVKVKVPGDKFLESISWSDIDLDDDAYTMKAYPVSLMPTTPAGRLQRVQELYQSGLLTDTSPAGTWARSALDFPDLESVMNLQNAALDDANRVVADIVDNGNYVAPEPYQDLALLSKTAQQSYLLGKGKGLSEAKQELLRRLIDECQRMQAPPPAPPAAPMMDPGMPPEGAPMPEPMPGPGPGPMPEPMPPQ
jgi:hypothetical protein